MDAARLDTPLKRILVIGASGHFGGRICRRIVGEPGTELVVCSRQLDTAENIVATLRCNHADAAISAARLDHSAPGFEAELIALDPDIVIHTAGPYQGQDYGVANSCIAAGSHYIDLADGRQFVQEFDALHAAAQSADLLLISGASTLPGLSSVVIDDAGEKFRAIRKVEISIAPAHQTPRGAGTVAAVLSYCGKPFEVLIDNEWRDRYGWHDMRSHRYPDFGWRLSGACDVPDLGLLPSYVGGVSTVTFHAALEAKWEQVALWLMGWITRAGIVKEWGRWVPTFRRVSNRLIHLGSDVGGMHIRLSGESNDGESTTLTWNLVARQNHGPEIPCTPALILARKLAADEIAIRGAMPCLGLFSLTDFDREMSDFDISHQWSAR